MGYSLVDGLDEWRLRTLGEWASLAVRAYRNGATTFSGPNNIINFFMDDLLSFAPEAGAGFIDRIQMTVSVRSRPRPYRRCWLPWPDLGEHRPSRLVATAAEDRLSFVQRSRYA